MDKDLKFEKLKHFYRKKKKKTIVKLKIVSRLLSTEILTKFKFKVYGICYFPNYNKKTKIDLVKNDCDVIFIFILSFSAVFLAIR